MKVQLIKPHTHARVRMQPGDVVDVSDADAVWLKEHDVAQQIKQPRRLHAVSDSDAATDEDAT